MKKMVAIAITAVLALTTVGFGFAKWSSSVDANVVINTGTVQIGIRDVGTNDDGTDVGVADFGNVPTGFGLPNEGNLGADPQWGPTEGGLGLNSEMKDVAKKVSKNDTTKVVGNIQGVDYYESITEEITNAYPWYGPTSVVEIANLGTIPVKIEALVWNWTAGTIDNRWYETVSYTISYPTATGTATVTGNGTDNMLAALRSIQLHGGDVITLTMKEGLREEANGVAGAALLPQGASGTATMSITASQWNEVK